MAALMAAARDPAFPASVALVLSNRTDAPGLALARDEGVAASVVDHKIYAGREEFERSMQALIDLHRIDYICLAGFMRVLSPWFVERWRGRMLNVHPSLLPAFRGLDTHARAIAAGVKLHGCTVHFVTPGLDEGPIVAQAALAVRDDDTPQALAARVLALEHRLYPQALARLAEGRLRIDGARVFGAEGIQV
jgi:phosphoribosylglycinamide formyltransferase-1